jgi:SAM-dependent methyltransferase
VTATEAEWWRSLRGDDIGLNTQGDPPYDAGRVADLISLRLGDPGTVLDLGCGTGRLAAVYQVQTQAKVVGFDPSPQILAVAREHAPQVEFTDRLPDGPFGGAYCVTVFQHLPHETCARYVAEVVARLTPGGRFCFQYVEGIEDAFLSHQATESVVRSWCDGHEVTVELDSENEQWRWVTVR